MSAGHTAGPWLAARINASSVNAVPHPIHGFKAQVLGGPISQMVAHAFGKTAKEAQANARLIAASPESHEANREAVDFLRSYFGPIASDNLAAWSDDDARQVCEKLEAAIARATGAA